MKQFIYILACILLVSCTSEQPAPNFLKILNLNGPVKEVVYTSEIFDDSPLIGPGIEMSDNSSTGEVSVRKVALLFDEAGFLISRKVFLHSPSSIINPNSPIDFEISTEYTYHKNNVIEHTSGLDNIELTKIPRSPFARREVFNLEIDLDSLMRIKTTRYQENSCQFIYDQDGHLFQRVIKMPFNSHTITDNYSQNNLTLRESKFSYGNEAIITIIEPQHNERGAITDEIYHYSNSFRSREEKVYTNYFYDQYDNWIQRTSAWKDKFDAKDIKVETRSISYY